MGKNNNLVSAENSDNDHLQLSIQPPNMVSPSSSSFAEKENVQPPVLTAFNNLQNPKPSSFPLYDYVRSSPTSCSSSKVQFQDFFKPSSSSSNWNEQINKSDEDEQTKKPDGDKQEDDGLDLSLSIKPSETPPPSMPPPPPPPQSPPPPSNQPQPEPNHPIHGIGRQIKTRRNPFQKPKRGKGETVDEVYPWATNRRAKVHTIQYLLSNGVSYIRGQIECKECQETFFADFKLEETFNEIREFVTANKSCLNNRAPTAWMNPRLYSCKNCGSEMKPVVGKKREINWLFLLLGNMLGCCKLSELKYFCKHNKKHRTGAKNRLLFSTYIGLCQQLEPNNKSFDIDLD